jgi:glycosyltransferase involved in cell wall biosynthesis
MIRKHRIDLIIVRDLPLAPTALLAAGAQCPVILDMAENYPAMIRDVWTDGRQGRFDFLVRNPSLVAAVERKVVRRVDYIITVVEESSRRLAELGVPNERLAVVSNTPPRNRVTAPKPRSSDGTLRLIYLGLMEKHRGIECSLDAAAILRQRGIRFHLDLVGDGRDFEYFRGRARTLGLPAEQVNFHGRVDHDRALALLGESHVGLVPHEARESWNTTIPNKLFDYMAAGLAVVTSDAKPAARVVNQAGAGLVFRSGDGPEMAEMISRCLDLSAWERYRLAGQEAIRTHYNWETDVGILLDVVTRIGLKRGEND